VTSKRPQRTAVNATLHTYRAKMSKRNLRPLAALALVALIGSISAAHQVDRKMTINGQRGCHPKIMDRFDLTLECIRRHYLDEPSPLSDTLARYADFFGLFDDFAGYVDFFHLQDLMNEVTQTVKFSMPFEDFTTSPLPGTVDAYLAYRQRATEFIVSRNRRIAAHLGAAR
jgi:hypothetical protein